MSTDQASHDKPLPNPIKKSAYARILIRSIIEILPVKSSALSGLRTTLPKSAHSISLSIHNTR